MKQKVSVPFMILGIIFVVCLITANLLETKLIKLGPIDVTAGLLVFPISYIINDCIAEVWGFKKTRLVIWCGFAMNFFVVLMGFIAVQIPAASFWDGAEHFNFVFNFAPRITLASLLAFLAGSFLNAYVMSKMKLMHGEKHFSLRAILSTIVGESADSLVFFPIAFWGIISNAELLKLMLVQVCLKTVYEIIILPVTKRLVKRLKSIEGSTYDENISYDFWNVTDIE
ncbi:queuosine precursor transporter [Porphyromonadaceae bacterium W3.11]|nr:queuosine precursor transporter [Porphyromonadaceae bacterium W3.11]